VVAFTGQVNRAVIGTDAFQECDIIGVSASVTKYNMQVREPNEIPDAVKRSFYIANTGRKGAVLVDIPKDCTTLSQEMDFNPKIKFRGYNTNHTPRAQELDWAAKIISEAKRPIIVAGGGVIAAGASNELVALSELLLAPTANTLMGKGAVKLREGRANRLLLKAGDMGYWSLGWKYSVKNTGKVPGSFFWGISRPPKGIERRAVSEIPEWLKRLQS